MTDPSRIFIFRYLVNDFGSTTLCIFCSVINVLGIDLKYHASYVSVYLDTGWLLVSITV